jgi:hypothetical protein
MTSFHFNCKHRHIDNALNIANQAKPDQELILFRNKTKLNSMGYLKAIERGDLKVSHS